MIRSNEVCTYTLTEEGLRTEECWEVAVCWFEVKVGHR